MSTTRMMHLYTHITPTNSHSHTTSSLSIICMSPGLDAVPHKCFHYPCKGPFLLLPCEIKVSQLPPGHHIKTDFLWLGHQVFQYKETDMLDICSLSHG